MRCMAKLGYEFIQTNTQNDWLIDEIFLLYEAKLIKRIPLSGSRSAYRLVWRGTKTGDYMVVLTICHGEYIDGGVVSTRDLWQDLGSWVPNRAKLFFWRTCNRILPKRVTLFKRKVINLWEISVRFSRRGHWIWSNIPCFLWKNAPMLTSYGMPTS